MKSKRILVFMIFLSAGCMHPLYETAHIPEEGKLTVGVGASYTDWLYHVLSGDVEYDTHFKGVRVDGFMGYSPTKWLALSTRGYGSWGKCERYDSYYNRWEPTDYPWHFPVGGNVSAKLVPFHPDWGTVALKVEAGFPVLCMCYALVDIKDKVTLYFPFFFIPIPGGIGCVIPLGNIKEGSFIKYITINYAPLSREPAKAPGTNYHETYIGIGVRLVE